ncbi:MAG TPA: GntR family transcriptional regulator [Oceanospirillaceae bacterium]|nr:GntR family transcriptional regulator [Oceanospirillaceae bacterium]
MRMNLAIDEEIAQSIINDVMEQRLAPGTRLSEKRLCDTFSTSRMYARRALLTLANRHVVELTANKGARIRKPTLQQAKHLFAARRAIEPVIITALIGQRTQAHIIALEAHLQVEQQAYLDNQRHDLIRLSGEFHLLLASMQSNALLADFMQTLITESSLITGMYGQQSFANCPPHEHRDLVAAIVAKDEATALTLMAQHLHHIEADLALNAK